MDLAFAAAASAFEVLLTPLRMGFLLLGVVAGLIIGIIPGLGGIVGLSLLLPFTFGMDAYSAMALLMGLAAAVSLGDSIPAVLFGVPGTVGCAATVMDGYPMAKRGEAGRALGAAFSASLLGGVFGAALLAITIPVISPVVLFFRSPELFAICIFGMSLVATLSGNAPLKGLTAAAFGLLLSMIGEDSQTGTLRLTFDSLYLWTGLPVVPVALAVFAIPELCDIMINRTAIAGKHKFDLLRDQWQGFKDALANWFLVGRTGALGAVCGMVPGLGAAVIDWIAYGHAVKTEKGATQSFGKGDVRGVIASESSTNARESGALVTIIAFGVPAHASTAILFGAFLIQGIVPGPTMLSKNLDLTYTIVWSLALANVLGAAICFGFANQFARIATVRYTILLPVVMTLIFIGAFEGQRSWGDLVALLVLGLFAWIMKFCGWPRPPLVLGFILGGLIERYMFISVERYDWAWLTNWFVLLMFALSILAVVKPAIASLRDKSGHPTTQLLGRPTLSLRSVFAFGVLTIFCGTLIVESQWPFEARLVPQIVSIAGVLFALLLLASETFRLAHSAGDADSPPPIGAVRGAMDLYIGYGALPQREVYRRALGYFLWIYGVLAVGLLIGLLPALALFTFAFLRFHGRESWAVTSGTTGATFAFLWFLFDYLVHVPWPEAAIGNLFPELRTVVRWF